MKPYPKLKVFSYFCCAPAIGGIVASFCMTVGVLEHLIESHAWAWAAVWELFGFLVLSSLIFAGFAMLFCAIPAAVLAFAYILLKLHRTKMVCVLIAATGGVAGYLWMRWIFPATNQPRQPWWWDYLFFFAGAISSLIISVRALPVREVANRDC